VLVRNIKIRLITIIVGIIVQTPIVATVALFLTLQIIEDETKFLDLDQKADQTKI